MPQQVTVDRPLFLTAEGDLVEEGDPRAQWAWAIAGSSRSLSEAKRLGYEPRTKAAPAPANKAQTAPSDDKSSGSDLACDECGKVAKTAAGLAAHKRSHD